MQRWASHALDTLQTSAAALVTITRVVGSAPREAGARMLVTQAGVIGTIGGGNLEHIAIEQARLLMEDRARSFLQQDYPLGPLIGQCCGGRVALLIERLDDPAWIAEAAAYEAAGEAYLLTRRVVDGSLHRSFASVQDAAAQVVLRDAEGAPLGRTQRTWTTMEEIFAPRGARVLLFGAGHVGRALAPLLANLSFDLDWIDTRDDVEGLPDAQLRRVDDPVACVAAEPPDALYLIMTHNHDLDYAIVRAALARRDARYVGLIGSHTKRRRFLSRLARDGVADADARLTCPIGSLGVRDKTPASIAVCAAVELLRVRESAAPAREAPALVETST